jgi:hypothetical protein
LKKGVRLLIDFSIILRKNYNQYQNNFEYAELESNDFKEFALFRHMVIQSLLELKNNINPDEVIIACDNKSWRKQYYPKYKANRDYSGLTKYFNEFNKLIEELTQYFPFKVINIQGLEGDDIIALFILHNDKYNYINVVTSKDSDLKQLLLYPNTIYYHIDDKKSLELSESEIKEQLLIKLLKGDKTDNVPNVYTDEIIKGTRQKSVTKGFIEDCKEDIKKVMMYDKAISERYERNKKLIFLSKNNIPVDLQNKMLEFYDSYKFPGNKEQLLCYMNEWKMEFLKERINEFDSLWKE